MDRLLHSRDEVSTWDGLDVSVAGRELGGSVVRRLFLAAGVAAVLAMPVRAQENATLMMRSGEKVSGQLIDMGGIGFTMRVNGEEREVPLAEVAAIDFLAGPPREAADGARLPAKGHHIIWLRTGESASSTISPAVVPSASSSEPAPANGSSRRRRSAGSCSRATRSRSRPRERRRRTPPMV
jgi:hypothetical protein